MPTNLEIRRQVGSRIRVRRVEVGLSQQELADAVGADQTQVSAWENGRRVLRIEDAMAIAKVLECKVSHLTGEEPRIAA